LTYQQFDQLTNQFANHLIDLGVRPSALVGISMNRSLEMLIAVLGTLKAGAGYVPLDPTYPQERIAYMTADAQLALVVTQKAYENKFASFDVPIVYVEKDWLSHLSLDDCRPDILSNPDNLAYAIHTSGSTGKPKGVMVPHRSLFNFMEIATKEIATNALGGSSEDIYLLSASLNYALSVRQIFVPLYQGATLVIASEQQVENPLSFLKLLHQQKITRMDLVPSYWRALIETLEDLPAKQRMDLLNNSLKQIVSIGEQLPSDLPNKWANVFNHHARLINIFGQTETTGIVAAFVIPKDLAGERAIVPIGSPVLNTTIMLMDEDLSPVAPGEAGEICISNPCLARGYLNNAKLTDQKFISMPGLEACLYRTGDLGRLLRGGTIEHLGRLDHQIKIRGKRVELGEIESVLRSHKEVKNSVVIPNKSYLGDQQLAAFYVPISGTELTNRSLRNFLDSKLPDYMIPLTFVELDKIPTMPNGKIDRLYLEKILHQEGSSSGQALLNREELRDWFYIPVWQPEELEAGQDPYQKTSTWLLFVNEDNPGQKITSLLEQQGHTVICVTQGEKYDQRGEHQYRINPAGSDDFLQLIQRLDGQDAFPDNVLYLWGHSDVNLDVPGTEASKDALNKAYLGLIFLVKALGTKSSSSKIRLGIVTCFAQKVTGNDLHHPEQTLLIGAGRVIPLEYQHIACVCMDFDARWDGQNVILNLVHSENNATIAYRNDKRFVQTYQSMQMEKNSDQVRLKRDGVYLVTGGLGGIGLEVGEYLARSFDAKIALLGRTSFPDRAKWNSWLQEHDSRNSISRKIRKLQMIQKQGGDVSIFQADVSDRKQMKEVVEEILDRYGTIHGVFHAAGERRVFTPIQEASIESTQNVLTAKVDGTLVVSESLKNINLDFMVLFSSISSVLGRLGQVDYCAANAFLDAFACFQTQRNKFTQSINWDVWQETELDAEAQATPILHALREEDLKFGIPPEEGLEALTRILGESHTRVIVSTRNLHQRFYYPRIMLRTLASDSEKVQYIPPKTPTEKLLADIWHEVLGIERVGLQDNFFELGGHSISAVRMISRVRQAFDVEMPIRTVFDAPTLCEVAIEVEKLQSQIDQKQIGRIQPISREKYRYQRPSDDNKNKKNKRK
jgi:amino acid adenylation domain-containing protein